MPDSDVHHARQALLCNAQFCSDLFEFIAVHCDMMACLGGAFKREKS